MNSRQTTITILTHTLSWAALLLVPLMSMSHGDGLQTRQVLVSVGVTLSFMAVFYPNFLWFTPRYYGQKGHLRFLLANTVVVILTALAFHSWMEMVNAYWPDPLKPSPHHDQPDLLHILRNIFNLSIVGVVATALQLASRWRKTEEARLEAEAARTAAELKTLRSQINPHFLLNTLNNIYALTAIDATRAQTAIQQLSKMLRHLLYDYEQPLVPLQDEVEFLQNYINLMRIRLPKNVDVSYQYHIGQHEQQLVAPMVFIPLVENAFKHGISPIEHSFIHVTIEADQQHIGCHIANSNHPKSANDHSGHGIGLQQVQRRLELIYPDGYTWHHGPSDDGKTYTSHIDIRLQ